MSKEGELIVQYDGRNLPLWCSRNEMGSSAKSFEGLCSGNEKKKNKLETGSAKTQLKSAKLELKSTKLSQRAITKKQMNKAMKFRLKANKLNLKSAKLRNKGQKWVRQMDKTFKNYRVERDSDGSYIVTKIRED